MCSYQKIIYNNGKEIIICEPKNTVCLFCILGNSKQYNEIKKEAEGNKK